MYYKRCRDCHETLPLEDFAERPNGSRVYRCRECAQSDFENMTQSPDFDEEHNAALSMIKYYGVCNKCGCHDREKFQLFAKEYRNGTLHFCWYCLSCGTDTGAVKQPHKDINVKLLPRKVPKDKNLCAVVGCERYDTERHHWLPRHLAQWELSESFPQSYLCRKHHQLWHRLVTPNMYKKGKMK